MNRDELIELKNKLLNTKYYVAMHVQNDAFSIESEPMTIEEIESKVDNYKVMKCYEDAIEKAVYETTMKGEDISSFCVNVDANIFVEYNLAKQIMNSYKEQIESKPIPNYNWQERYEEWLKPFKSKLNELILPNYVMIDSTSNYPVWYEEGDDLTPEDFDYFPIESDTLVKAEGIIDLTTFKSDFESKGYEWSPKENYPITRNTITADDFLNFAYKMGNSIGYVGVNLGNKKIR